MKQRGHCTQISPNDCIHPHFSPSLIDYTKQYVQDTSILVLWVGSRPPQHAFCIKILFLAMNLCTSKRTCSLPDAVKINWFTPETASTLSYRTHRNRTAGECLSDAGVGRAGLTERLSSGFRTITPAHCLLLMDMSTFVTFMIRNELCTGVNNMREAVDSVAATYYYRKMEQKYQ